MESNIFCNGKIPKGGRRGRRKMQTVHDTTMRLAHVNTTPAQNNTVAYLTSPLAAAASRGQADLQIGALRQLQTYQETITQHISQALTLHLPHEGELACR